MYTGIYKLAKELICLSYDATRLGFIQSNPKIRLIKSYPIL